MEVIYGLIPFVLGVGFIVVLLFFWMARSGQFDDLDGEGSRILMDDEDFEPRIPLKRPATTTQTADQPQEHSDVEHSQKDK